MGTAGLPFDAPGAQAKLASAMPFNRPRAADGPPRELAHRVRVRHLFISPGHNFFGRRELPAGDNPTVEVDAVECVAGYGLRGDRFFGYRPDYAGQVTLFDFAVYEAIKQAFAVPGLPASAFRRNVVTAGVDLNELIGVRFRLQDLELEGTGECRPCAWMNHAVAPGAEEWLKGRGGLRCKVLRGGWLRRDGE